MKDCDCFIHGDTVYRETKYSEKLFSDYNNGEINDYFCYIKDAKTFIQPFNLAEVKFWNYEELLDKHPEWFI